MNKPVLLAALAAALPACALAQEAVPDGPPPQRDCAATVEAPPASGALPARASTRPEPQRGTVAPNTRVLSQTDTPSLRAMRAASASEAEHAVDAPANAGRECAPPGTDRNAQQREQKG